MGEPCTGEIVEQLQKEIRDLDANLIYITEMKQSIDAEFQEEAYRKVIIENQRNLAKCVTFARIPSNSTVRRRAAVAIVEENFDNPQSGVPAAVREDLSTIIDLEDQLRATGCGSFTVDDKGILTISANILKMLHAKVVPELVERAYRLDLLEIGFGGKSSGEAAIFHQMTSLSHSVRQLAAKGCRSFLIFIDEGDMLLHLEWQRRYLGLLDERLGSLKSDSALDISSLQVIVATHSPLLATDALRASITRMPDDSSALPAFGAPLQKIVNEGFGTKSVGSIAERKIRELMNKDSLSDSDRLLLEQIDDDFVKSYIKSKKSRQ